MFMRALPIMFNKANHAGKETIDSRTARACRTLPKLVFCNDNPARQTVALDFRARQRGGMEPVGDGTIESRGLRRIYRCGSGSSLACPQTARPRIAARWLEQNHPE